mmetsp:Transcript_45238/g.131030  ORF Transcript_45238/g.131030 Transcript_45238/m.131030 type:complete len:302 (+) Transcript_45238:257-1162(+)
MNRIGCEPVARPVPRHLVVVCLCSLVVDSPKMFERVCHEEKVQEDMEQEGFAYEQGKALRGQDATGREDGVELEDHRRGQHGAGQAQQPLHRGVHGARGQVEVLHLPQNSVMVEDVHEHVADQQTDKRLQDPTRGRVKTHCGQDSVHNDVTVPCQIHGDGLQARLSVLSAQGPGSYEPVAYVVGQTHGKNSLRYERYQEARREVVLIESPSEDLHHGIRLKDCSAVRQVLEQDTVSSADSPSDHAHVRGAHHDPQVNQSIHQHGARVQQHVRLLHVVPGPEAHPLGDGGAEEVHDLVADDH